MQRIKLLLLWLFVLIITGCGNMYDDPSKVATEVVKRLSNGQYNKIYELINIPENFYNNDDIFISYLEEKNLNIYGNKNQKVVNKIVTEDEAIIEILIDDNKKITFYLVKVNGKWLVNINDDMDEFSILVPVNASVYLNDTKIDRTTYSNIISEEEEINWGYGVSLKYTYNLDQYLLPNILDNWYNLKIELDNCESEIDYIKPSLVDGKYILELTELEKEKIIEFVKNYYNSLFDAINKKKNFKELESYYDMQNDELERIKISFDKNKNGLYHNYKFDDLKQDSSINQKIYYYGDGQIIFIAETIGSYLYDQVKNIVSIKTMFNIVYVDGKYLIKSGIGVIPEF